MNRDRVVKWIMWLLLATVMPIGIPAGASAHGVTVFAWVEGDTIHTESKFSGGREVHEGKIAVYDATGSNLLEGVTDDRGRFSFAIPPRDKRAPGDLKIVLTAGAGHGNEWIVTAAEMTGADGSQPSAVQAAASPATAQAGPATTLDDSPCVSTARIEQIVRLNLERQIGPLRAQLADPAWGLRDIVAGIGYILGLMGLAAYLHSRRQGKGAP